MWVVIAFTKQKHSTKSCANKYYLLLEDPFNYSKFKMLLVDESTIRDSNILDVNTCIQIEAVLSARLRGRE